MKTPWDYSEPGDPATAVPNLPCAAGEALGIEIARLVEIEKPAHDARYPHALPMCNECLCRKGTVPNRTASSLMDMLKCVIEGQPFYCHKGVADTDEPKRLCAGYGILATAEYRRQSEATP